MATADEGRAAHVKLTAVGGLSFAGDLEITVIDGIRTSETVTADVDGQVQGRATADDWTLVLVPWVVGTGVFGVVAVCADPVSGVIWGVAFLLIAIIAMRDETFSKLVARAARYLRGE